MRFGSIWKVNRRAYLAIFISFTSLHLDIFFHHCSTSMPGRSCAITVISVTYLTARVGCCRVLPTFRSWRTPLTGPIYRADLGSYASRPTPEQETLCITPRWAWRWFTPLTSGTITSKARFGPKANSPNTTSWQLCWLYIPACATRSHYRTVVGSRSVERCLCGKSRHFIHFIHLHFVFTGHNTATSW